MTTAATEFLPLAREAARAAAAVLLADWSPVIAEGASATKSSDTDPVTRADVASGHIDAFYENDLSPWDWAAGALLAAEAGASVAELAGPDGRSGIVATVPALAGPLGDVLG